MIHDLDISAFNCLWHFDIIQSADRLDPDGAENIIADRDLESGGLGHTSSRAAGEGASPIRGHRASIQVFFFRFLLILIHTPYTRTSARILTINTVAFLPFDASGLSPRV